MLVNIIRALSRSILNVNEFRYSGVKDFITGIHQQFLGVYVFVSTKQKFYTFFFFGIYYFIVQ